jgi:GNAT superfamily N-acetyltransferase
MELTFREARVDAGDGATLVAAMRAEIAAIYEGVVLDGDAMPRAGAAELSPPGGGFWVAHDAASGALVCCGGVKDLGDGVCEIKRMFVAPAFRGQGVAGRLLGFLEQRARAAGHRVARLDTGPSQPHAQRLYEGAGYREIGNFNANPMATYFAEKAL